MTVSKERHLSAEASENDANPAPEHAADPEVFDALGYLAIAAANRPESESERIVLTAYKRNFFKRFFPELQDAPDEQIIYMLEQIPKLVEQGAYRFSKLENNEERTHRLFLWLGVKLPRRSRIW